MIGSKLLTNQKVIRFTVKVYIKKKKKNLKNLKLKKKTSLLLVCQVSNLTP